jgi:glycosyltransferase involved in cell wall biosynthesis
MSLANSVAEEVYVKRVKPSILQRLLAERWLVKNVVFSDVVLCFGNLPPLFKLRGHVVVFVQNRYLIDNEVKLTGFSIKTRLRLCVERFWFSHRMSNVDEFIVQTPSMRNILETRILNKVPINVIPFMENQVGYVRKVDMPKIFKEKDFDFLYVASGEPHKNHRKLIEAWCLLAKEGFYPSLKLTLDNVNFAELCAWITQKVADCRLNVENKGRLTHDQVKLIYNQAGALIYPSTFESFGLPLIEARQAGLPVLASELDYVRDVLDPEQVFDPESAVSIARAVKRFIAVDESPLPLQDATGFIKHILNRIE